MPAINDQLVLAATNKALAELTPSGNLPSLDSEDKSDTEWSCNNFSPATLDFVQQASEGEMVTTNYKGDPAEWPDTFPAQSFANFSIMFKVSSSNHNFNVYFKADDSSYRIQVYVDNSIRISTPQSSSEFIALWKQLATDNWATAYETLFYVKPNTQDNAYTEQYVTVVTAS